MSRAKIVTKVVAVSLVAAIMLTGCDATSVEKMQHIGENFTKISEQFDPEVTQSIAENAQAIAEDTTEFTENYNDRIEASNEEIAKEREEEAKEAVDEVIKDSADEADASVEEFELSEEDIQRAILEEIANDIIASLMAELEKYKERGEKLIAEVVGMRKSGIMMIQDGVKLLDDVIQNSDPNMTVEEAIDNSFDGLKLIVEGSDEVANGANIVLDETVNWANNIVAQAEDIGINSDALDKLKTELAEAKQYKVEAFPSETADQIEKYRDEVKDEVSKQLKSVENLEADIPTIELDIDIDTEEIITDAFENADAIMEDANKAARTAARLYKKANKAAQELIVEARVLGIDIKELDTAEKYLKEYEYVTDGMQFIAPDDYAKVANELDKVIDYADKLDVNKMLEGILE